MARKPNYNFERKERDRIKAEKLAAKAQAKRDEKALAERDGDEAASHRRSMPIRSPEP